MRLLVSLFLFVTSILCSYGQTSPATEIRAVWLTTNWALDWPRLGTSTEEQKADLTKILDQLKKDNFNLVLFQVRAQGYAFYNSKIEPKIDYFKSDFDPLSFAVSECHKRGMECHAWIVTYPMGSDNPSVKKKKISRSPYQKLSDGQWFLDPGDRRSKQHILSIVKEVVINYDIDGIHFDYIRYPNRDKTFPDATTYRKNGVGYDLYDWRRKNINDLVEKIYDTTKALKNWVQVSSSPLGKYRDLPSIKATDGWTAYETVFQDAAKWMNDGKHDLLFPMLYYQDEAFYPYLDDWKHATLRGYIIPGLGVYKMLETEKNWDSKVIVDQIEYARKNDFVGQAYFRTEMIINNTKGIKDSIKSLYPYKAKLPPLTWLDSDIPPQPINFEIERDTNNIIHISWEKPETEKDLTYTIYVNFDDHLNTNDGAQILETGIRTTQFSFPSTVGEYGFYYTITASDRYHNESEPRPSEFFSHSSEEK